MYLMISQDQSDVEIPLDGTKKIKKEKRNDI